MAEEIKIVASAVGFDQVNKALESTSQTLTQTSEAASKAGKNLGNQLKVGTNKATQSLTDLSRVVQDAPYGFIGIANNINPLVESFGRLKAESGSTGGALKSLLSGLSGPAGLGIAFAAITTAITFAQIGLSAWSRGSEKAKKSNEDFSRELEQAKESIKNVTYELENFIAVSDAASRLSDINIKARFSDEGTQEALTRQSKFISIAYDLQEAIDALNQAKQEYLDLTQGVDESEKDYQDRLKTSSDVVKKLINQVGNLTQAKEEQAAANRLAVIEEKRAEAERLKNLDSIAKTLAKLEEDTRDQRSLAITFNISTLQEQANLVKAAITKLITVFNVDPKNEIILKLQADLADLNMQIRRENQIAPVKLPFEFDKKIPKLPAVKIPKIELPSLEDIQTAANLANLFSFLPTNFFKPFSEDTLLSIRKTFTEGFESIAEDTAILFGQTLGDALTGQASIGDFFKGIFASLGANLEALGKFLVKTAIEIELIQKTLFTNPFLAIAGGIALIAIGRAISNATNRNAFAVGTRYAPGGMALVGERGPEMINLPRGSQVIPAAQTSQMMGGIGGAIEVFGMLRGQDIYFSNKKYGQTYKRTT
jgi:hypothetical protein